VVELWYAILVFMLGLYVVLDGMAIGAGVVHFVVGKSDDDRRLIMKAIGPFWLWNEVWLVAAGAVAILAFPAATGVAFSGLYMALMMLLWGLIGRGIAIEFADHIKDRLWQSFWNTAFAACSVLLAGIVGLVLGNIVRGVPLGPDGRFILPLFTDFGVRGEVGILDWYTISFAAFLFTCLAAHGASFLALRTEGAVNIRAQSIAKLLWWAVLSSLPVISVMTWYVRPELFEGITSRPLAWAFVIATLCGAWSIIAGVQGKVEAKTFLGGCVFLLGFMGSAAIGVFPVFLKSTLGEGNSILVFGGGASEYGLKIGLLWWPVALAITVVHVRFLIRNFGGKLGTTPGLQLHAKSSGSHLTEGYDIHVSSEELTMDSDSMTATPRTRVIIVGGGFGGLAAARALRKAPVQVILIDKTNHHVFQPLLYQVATSVLSPENIAAPIRHVLRKQTNTTVVQATVIGVDTGKKLCFVEGILQPLPYDFLILATGVQHSYFGHEEYAPFAPGLKTLADAVQLRNKILSAFEVCERTSEPDDHLELLTFIIVGGGATGVELAGAIAELAHQTLTAEFRRFDPASLKLILVEAGPRILPSFDESLAAAATAKLTKLGVEVRTGAPVEKVDAEGIILRGERIRTQNVFWAAGVKGSPAARWLGVEADRVGRVKVHADCSVPSHPEVFVVGDTACLEVGGKPLPGVAQVAIQQGRYVGRLIAGRLKGKPAPPAFKYFDKGNLATVGRNFAIMQAFGIRSAGLFAKLIWAFVHIQFLVLTSSRIGTLFRWSWKLLTRQRLARLIIDPELPKEVRTQPMPEREPEAIAR